MPLSPKKVVSMAVQAAKTKKAYDILILDISQISIIADYFLICSGRSAVHVKAIAEEIMEALETITGLVPRKEGLREGRWVLLDYGDVVIHIFQDAERQFYNLERLWGDAPSIDIPVNL